MVKRNRLTNNSDETEIASLLSGDVVFSIPFFQRSYKWGTKRLEQLNQDILAIVGEETEFHFLGAVIIHGRSSNPSDPKIYEVIDGQQRITTLFLYIAAAIKVLAENNEHAEASSLFLKYLAIPRETNQPSNLKLHPCKEDRSQFNNVILELLKNKNLNDKLGSFKVKLLPDTGVKNGILKKNYRLAIQFMKSQCDEGGVSRLRNVCKSLLESISVVQIDVWDPTNGPKIFDSLNSRQEPMTIGDLVRNEIFSKIANKSTDEIEQIDRQYWQPFYKRFQDAGANLFDAYFFPYGLIQDPNLKKSEVYGYLRDKWSGHDKPEDIIAQLAEYQNAFIDIVSGTNTQRHGKKIEKFLKNLYLSGSPSSTYPFLMKLSLAITNEEVAENDACDSLSVIESLLVRRAVCGHEPTGLHAVFKRLWSDCKGKPSLDTIKKEIAKHKTVAWPKNNEFCDAIKTRSMYGVNITKYFLQEYDRSLNGDMPDNIPWIEHVLPQTLQKEWRREFSKIEHAKLVHTLANMIPLSKEMNITIGNKPYILKREHFKGDSMFKSARQFAQSYDSWTPQLIEKRADELAKWAVKRWPY